MRGEVLVFDLSREIFLRNDTVIVGFERIQSVEIETYYNDDLNQTTYALLLKIKNKNSIEIDECHDIYLYELASAISKAIKKPLNVGRKYN